MKIKIYKLIDPILKEVRYVGQTKNELITRLVGHIRETETKPFRPLKNDWVISLLLQNLCPIIELIEEVDNSKLAKQREKFWIDFYQQFSPLYNIMLNNDEDFLKTLAGRHPVTIYEYDLNGIFIKEWKSIAEAARNYNIDSSNICYAASGKRKQAGNRMWRYYKKDTIPNYFRKIITKPVHKYDREGNFIESFKSAREIIDVSFKLISKCCKTPNFTVKGFRYSYEKVDKLPPIIRKKRNITNGKYLINKVGKEVYDKVCSGISITELCKEYDVTRQTMYDMLKRCSKSKEDYQLILSKQPRGSNSLRLTKEVKEKVWEYYLTLPKPKPNEKFKQYNHIGEKFELSGETIRKFLFEKIKQLENQ